MYYDHIVDVPKVYTPEELIGAELGRPVHIKCRASAYPEALIYWRHGSTNLIMIITEYFERIIYSQNKKLIKFVIIFR